MPTQEVWVFPDQALSHKGVTVYHTYGDNDINNGQSRYYFTTTPTSDDYSFDVREFDVPSRTMLDQHPPYLSDSDPRFATASDEQKAEWAQQWEQWHGPGGDEEQAIHAILREAIDLGMIIDSGEAEVGNRKISISAVITPDVAEADLQSIKNFLLQFGNVEFKFESEVEFHTPAEGGREVCIYREPNGPFIEVAYTGASQGTEVTEEELDTLREYGVCVELHAGNPKPDKAGNSGYATANDVAAGYVAELGFKVTNGNLHANLNGCGRKDLFDAYLTLKLVLPQ